MAAQWTTPATESSSLVTTELDSLADGSESTSFTIDNSSTKAFYTKIRLALGSITPTSGASVTIKLYGPNADIGSTPIAEYNSILTTTTSAKVVEWIIQLPPFALEATITNNSGVAFNSADNDIYSQTVGEENV